MTNSRFYKEEPYFSNCTSCDSRGIHYYTGYQEGIADIPGLHLGTCGNCGSTKKINLETKVE